MIKHIVALLLPVVAATAQAGIYSPGASRVAAQCRDNTASRVAGKGGVAYIPAMIQTADAAALEAAGAQINTRLGSWVTAMVPATLFGRLHTVEGVQRIEAANMSYPTLNVALPYMGYDNVLAAPDMEHPYQGEGVVVGIVDIGFQWDHAAFSNPDGTTRIVAAWNQNDTTGTAPAGYSYGSLYDTPEAILAATPCATETHATHVAGIAAGTQHDNIPYGGIARKAHLIFVDALHTPEGGIYSTGIVDGVKFIMEQAQALGSPCVINLSIGSTVGPRDGTSAFDLMCDSLQGPGRLIVGAMGNNGAYKSHISHTSGSNKTMRTGLRLNSTTLPFVDIWSEQPVKFAIELYSPDTDSLIAATHLLQPIDEVVDTALLVGEREILITTGGELNPANGKYNTQVYMTTTDEVPRVTIALVVEGEGGAMNMWCNAPAVEFDACGHNDWIAGDNNMSLLEVGGTGRRITSVGAYISNLSVDVQQGTFDAEGTLYDIAPFSSRGLTSDGRLKPEVVAPGITIVSAYNSVQAADPANFFHGLTVGSYALNGKEYYYGANAGTSMAAPMVTGTYALWLQANPQLTPELAKEVLATTSTQDEYTTSPAAAGYGKINPYGGLCYLLDVGGVEATRTLDARLYPTVANGTMHIVPATAHTPLQVEVFTLQGTVVMNERINVYNFTPIKVQLPALSPGIYPVRLTQGGRQVVYKYVVAATR